MYRHVLVAVDGSDISTRALKEALRLARDERAQVRIVHAVDAMPPPTTGEVYVDYDAHRQESLKAGRAVLNEALALARQAGLEPETILAEVQTEGTSGAIVEEARRWPADLIVMGTHGRSGLMHLLLGTVAEGVVRQTPTPVLLVRGG
jgi:nucleotide-binding universal stress UspA family protein